MSQLFKLKNGTVLLSTEVPGGVYNSVQLKKIAELCSKELAVVKATEDQRLALFVKESEVQHVAQQLRSIGLGFRNYQRGLHQPVTCLGELCEEHDQPALVTSMEVTKQIENLSLDAPLKIGINGCARCCTPCHTLDISVVGEPSGYRLSMGGKNSQVPELSTFFAENIPAKELPGLVKRIISLYRDKADPGESLSQVMDRCGVAEFIAVLAPYSQDAAYRTDPFEAGETLQASPDIDDLALNSAAQDLESEDVENASASLAADAEEDSPVTELDEIPIHDAGAANLSDDLSVDEHRHLDSATSPRLADDLSLQEDELEIVIEEDEVLDVSEAVPDPSEEALEVGDIDGETVVEDPDSDIVLVTDDDLDLEAAQSVEDIPDQDELIEEDSGLDTELELAREEEVESSSQSMTEASEAPMATLDAATKLNSTDDSELEESLPSGDHELSDEEETAFERKLEESIAEESRLLANADEDANSEERNEALELLEHDDTLDPDLERERSQADSTIKALAPDDDEVDIAPVAPKSAPKVKVTQNVGSSFRLAAVSFEAGAMRLKFESGAYVDFNLGSLQDGEEKSFFIGQQRITVEQQAEGYLVETDGMKMFYPKAITAA